MLLSYTCCYYQFQIEKCQFASQAFQPFELVSLQVLVMSYISIKERPLEERPLENIIQHYPLIPFLINGLSPFRL